MSGNRNTEEGYKKKKKKKKNKKKSKKKKEKKIYVWSVLGSFGSFNTETKNLHKMISLL